MSNGNIFISHASADRERVQVIVDALLQAGFSIWFDKKDLMGGATYAADLVKGIKACQVVVLMLSNASVTSQFVEREVGIATNDRKGILPIYLEEVELPDEFKFYLAPFQHLELFDLNDRAIKRVIDSLKNLGIQPENSQKPPEETAIDRGTAPKTIDTAHALVGGVGRYEDPTIPDLKYTAPEPPEPEPAPDEALVQAEGLYNLQHYEEAIRLLLEYLPRAGARVSEVYCQLGQNYLKNGDSAAALSAYETAVAKADRDLENQAHAHLGRGEVLTQRRDFDAAIDAYSTAVLIDDEYARHYVSLRLAILAEIKANPAQAALNYLHLARVINLQGQEGEARKFALAGVDRWLADNLVELRTALQEGELLSSLWEDGQIREAFERRQQQHGEYLDSLKRGEAALEAGQLDAATEAFAQSRELDPDAVRPGAALEEIERRRLMCRGHLDQVRALISAEVFEEAAQRLEQARNCDSSHPEIAAVEDQLEDARKRNAQVEELLDGVETLERQDRLEEAATALQSALSLASRRAEVQARIEELAPRREKRNLALQLVHKADNLDTRGEWTEALSSLRQAARIDPDYAEIQTRIEELGSRLAQANFERFLKSDLLARLIKQGLQAGGLDPEADLEKHLGEAGLLPISLAKAEAFLKRAYQKAMGTEILQCSRQVRSHIAGGNLDAAEAAIERIAVLDPRYPAFHGLRNEVREARRRQDAFEDLLERSRDLSTRGEYEALLRLQSEHEMADVDHAELKSLFATGRQRFQIRQRLEQVLERSRQALDRGENLEAYYCLLEAYLTADDDEYRTGVGEEIKPIETSIREREEQIRRALPENLVLIPSGFHLMGPPQAHDAQHLPLVCAFLDCYAIDRHPVTNQQYAEFLEFVQRGGKRTHVHCDRLEPQPKDHTPAGWTEDDAPEGDEPVVGIDWFDAFGYAGWAGKALPSEPQWEKAALWHDEQQRLQRYPWGDQFETSRCNTAEAGVGKAAAAGQFAAGVSPFDVHDLYGNVWEWCRDGHLRIYPASGKTWKRNPSGPVFGEARVLRGGSWMESDEDIGRMCRTRAFPLIRAPNIGLRCVQLIELDFS